MIRHETVEGYLRRLASGEPTPGGGATGALALAEGAALLSMAARYSDREDLAQQCIGIIDTALRLSDADEAGFGEVAEAFQEPNETPREKAERSEAIQNALEEAVQPPRDIVETAEHLLHFAERILADCNPHVFSDVGAALGMVHAGLVAAVATLESNRAPMKDPDEQRSIEQDQQEADRLIVRCGELTARVRDRIRV